MGFRSRAIDHLGAPVHASINADDAESPRTTRRVTLRRAPLVILSGAAAIVITACGTASQPTTSSPPASREPQETAVVSPSASSVDVSPEAPLDGQTDTAWGRIWDRLPGGFPAYAGSTPADEAATGPASAVLSLASGDVRKIATWFQARLEAAGFTTEALSGPMEDGGYVLDSVGSEPGCQTEITVAPLGGTISVTVLYGAACPLR